MTEGQITYVEKQGNIAWVVINRPRRMNTCNMALFQRLRDIMEQLDGEADVRVAVIRARGRCFTLGLDLKEAVKATYAMREHGRYGRANKPPAEKMVDISAGTYVTDIKTFGEQRWT